MADRFFIVATAGHVDHGKSALVRALTGIDPDRLPEEKARGITIDLGFAHLALPMPSPSTDTFRLGIVDVPGHEDFVKNMVAGVGSVDVALFVVAADDGWMPQSEEHLQILTYLGVSRAVVALTKADLVPSLPWATAAVRAMLQSSPFADALIIPTSTVTGQGIEELKTTLVGVLADAPLPHDHGKPRLPIDRVFTLRGIGTIVTGTLSGGSLRRGDEVVIQPSGHRAHIRSLQNHGRDAETTLPGTRTALNLPELDATGEAAVPRGETVMLAALGDPAAVMDVLLTRTARVDPRAVAGQGKSQGTRLLKDFARVRVHLGSGAWNARVRMLNGKSLMPGEQAIARLRFDRPIFAFAGDRFIIRDGAERATIAGGIVLDPNPGRATLRRPAQRRFLERRAAALNADALETAAEWLQRDLAIRRDKLLLRSSFGEAQITDAALRLVNLRSAVVQGDFLVDAGWWQTMRQRAADFIDARALDHPEQTGLPIRELRREFERRLPAPELLDALVDELVADCGYIRVGAAIRRASHRLNLPPPLRAVGAHIRATLASKPFEPPSRKELTPDAASRQALRFLCETGEAVEIGSELVLLEESYRRMKEIIARTIRSAGPATASELRQVLGTTRRVMIPVLEALDREGITLRDGDRRKLK